MKISVWGLRRLCLFFRCREINFSYMYVLYKHNCLLLWHFYPFSYKCLAQFRPGCFKDCYHSNSLCSVYLCRMLNLLCVVLCKHVKLDCENWTILHPAPFIGTVDYTMQILGFFCPHFPLSVRERRGSTPHFIQISTTLLGRFPRYRSGASFGSLFKYIVCNTHICLSSLSFLHLALLQDSFHGRFLIMHHISNVTS